MTNKDIVNRNHKGLLQGYCTRYDTENTILFRLNYQNGRHSGYCEWHKYMFMHKHFEFAQYFIR